MYNEIDGDFDDVAINTFKVDLLTKHGLRKSLTRKPSPVCTNSWAGLTSIIRLKKTNSRGKERIRLSLKRGGISGRSNTTTTGLEETLLGSQGLPMLKRLTRCFENQCIKF